MKPRIALLILVAACGKGTPAQQTTTPTPPPAPAEPPAPPPVADKAPPDNGEVTVTTSSPEALEHFKQGRALAENQRVAESVEHFTKALELDPGFAMAAMYLGRVTPGAEGAALRQKAVELAAKAPEPERQLIEANLAFGQNDDEKGTELLRKVVAARPRDWRAQLQLAQTAFGYENWDESVSASKKALEISPDAAVANNYVAYGLVWQGRYPEAIEAAEKQVAAMPGEPNPQDTLGEILLAAGKLDEAQAAFEKAIAASPKFTTSLQAIASIRVYKGDWKGAYEALKKAHDGAPRPLEAMQAAVNEAWLLAAQGKLPQAMKIYDAVEKLAADSKMEAPAVVLPANRGLLMAIAGKPKDALRQLDAAEKRLAAAALSPGPQRDATVQIDEGRLIVAMKQKKGADADKVLASLGEELKKLRIDRGAQSALDFGAGLAAWAKGDAKGAVASMSKCSAFDYACRFMLVSATRAAGDKAGATDLLAKLKASPRRDAPYVYFWVTTK